MYQKDPFIENFFRENAAGNNNCLVMFSGGKDSSYLLWLMKEVYQKEVIAFTIDNGFESLKSLHYAEEICKKLKVKHMVQKLDETMTNLFYQTLIKENQLFANLGINHICAMCSEMFNLVGLRFANENNIPVIINGFDPGQIHSFVPDFRGLKREIYNEALLNAIKYVNRAHLGLLRKTEIYKTNSLFASYIDGLFEFPKKGKILFPFLYIDYNIAEIKEVAKREFEWTSSKLNDKSEDSTYLSSGCQLIEALYGIEKLQLVKLTEQQQFEFLTQKGSVSVPFNFSGGDNVHISKDVFGKLSLIQYLTEKCELHNVTYEIGE